MLEKLLLDDLSDAFSRLPAGAKFCSLPVLKGEARWIASQTLLFSHWFAKRCGVKVRLDVTRPRFAVLTDPDHPRLPLCGAMAEEMATAVSSAIAPHKGRRGWSGNHQVWGSSELPFFTQRLTFDCHIMSSMMFQHQEHIKYTSLPTARCSRVPISNPYAWNDPPRACCSGFFQIFNRRPNGSGGQREPCRYEN